MKRSRDLKQDNPEVVVPLPRMSLSPPIPVEQIKGKDERNKFFGYAVNITRDGIFVPTVNPKPVGFRTRIRMPLSKMKTEIIGEIEVVWSKPFDPRKSQQPSGMGIKFIDLPEDKKLLIDAFMKI